MNDLLLHDEHALISELNTTMRAQFGERISGLSYNGNDLRVHFYAPYGTADEIAAQAILAAHDPVFISAARKGDEVTVMLTKPRNLDKATTLTVTIDDMTAPEASALVNNVATVAIESADTITIGILEDYPHQEVTL